MRIEVSPGEVRVTKVEVHRHEGGLYLAQITTPQDRRPAVVLSRGSRNGDLFAQADLYRPRFNTITKDYPTQITFRAELNDEDEAIMNGFTELDQWFKYGALLVSIPSSYLYEREEIAQWTPPSIDYLES